MAVIRKIEEKGIIDTAHRTNNIVGEIFAFAIAIGSADRNIAHDIKRALTAKVSKHRAAITDPKEVGALMRAIDSYNHGGHGSFIGIL